MKKLLYLLSLIPRCILAQDGSLHFDKIEGLSQNTVYTITKDRQGFLWIATADGLNRFDGVEIKIYKPSIHNQPGTYSNRMIRSPLLVDAADQIWFSSNAGLYSYDKKKDFFIQRKPAVTGTGFPISMDPILSEGSHVWGSNNTAGIFDYDIQSDKAHLYSVGEKPYSKVEFVKCITDVQHNFWALAENGILFFDRTKKTWEHLFKETGFTGIGAGVNCIYLISAGNIYSCDLKTFSLTKVETEGPANFFFKAIYTDKKGNTWMGDTQGNILCRKQNENYFKWLGNINPSGSAVKYPVYSLFADENDILWVGADVLGLLKAHTRPAAFQAYPSTIISGDKNSLFIHSICEEDEKLWLGTYQQGLLLLDKNKGVAEKINPSGVVSSDPDENSFQVIHLDKNGNLWAGNYTSLFVRKKGEHDFKKILLPRPVSYITEREMHPLALYEYNDTLYCSTYWGIYGIYNSGKNLKSYPETGVGFYYDIFIDSDKNFWLATESGVYRKKYLNKVFGETKGDTLLFKNLGIKSFHSDGNNHLLWISTTSGIIVYHLPSGRNKIFTEDDGLCNNHVYGLVKKDNELWISTNRGLSRAIIRFTQNDQLPSLSFTNYSSKDGLPDDEFNTGAFYKGKSGHLYFGTTKGVVWFRPEALLSNQQLPKIVMTNLLVNEEKADSLVAAGYIQRLSLPYNKNSFLFKFRGIDYISGDKVQYVYKLEGYDKAWIHSGTLNQVRYNNLPHGIYTFKVKAANSSGAWNEDAYTVSVIIRPPFWKTWWFYTAVGLLLIFSIILITRFFAQQKLKTKIAELEKQKEIEKERQRISREMHDDIGAGLTQITLMTESVKNKISLKELDDIAGTSRQLVNNMGEIIWSLNPEHKTLDDLCAYLREQLNRQLEYAGIDYSIQLPENGNAVLLTNEQRRNILLVTKEIINNAIKYSQAKNISVKAVSENDGLAFEIKDDGVGFDAEKNFSGNGLKNIRIRIEEIGGRLQADAQPGKGSRFHFFVPLLPNT